MAEILREEATIAVVAHGLMNSLAIVLGMAQALADTCADPVLASELLERIDWHTELSSSVLKDLVRGLPPEVMSAVEPHHPPCPRGALRHAVARRASSPRSTFDFCRRPDSKERTETS